MTSTILRVRAMAFLATRLLSADANGIGCLNIVNLQATPTATSARGRRRNGLSMWGIAICSLPAGRCLCMRDTKIGAKLRKIIEIAPLSALFAGVNVVCVGVLRGS